MHGIGGNAAHWLSRVNPEIDSLPIALAKQGYDVWIGNARGTSIAKEHEQLDWEADEAEYWDFSFPEIAMNDLPVQLSTVFEETDHKKINFVGFQLGATEILYALSDEEMQTELEK